MNKDYQERQKLFYASPVLFPEWPYPSRYAIGVNLDDFSARRAPVYRFLVKGKMYEIQRERANEVGRKYCLPSGVMKHLLPLDEFQIVEEHHEPTQTC